MTAKWKAALIAAAVIPAQAWAQDDRPHDGGPGGGHEQRGPQPGNGSRAAAQPQGAPPADAGVRAQGGFQGRPGGYRGQVDGRGQAGMAPAAPNQGGGGRPAQGYRDGGDPRGGSAPGGYGRPGYFGQGQPGAAQSAPPRDPRFGGGAPGQGDYRPSYGGGPGGYGGYGQRGPGYRPGGNPGGYPGARPDWNRGWHDDRRYDWSSYRYQNRAIFHLQPYYAPYGWRYGYQRFAIGVTLEPFLWAQDYWIDDPFYYRLPPAYGPYRWVRYYDDALLVDIDTGEVVDGAYGIFY